MHGSMLLKLDPMAQVKQATRSEERNRGLETLSSCKPSPPTTLVAAAADWPASRRQLVAAPKSASRSPPLAPLPQLRYRGCPFSSVGVVGSWVADGRICLLHHRIWRGAVLLHPTVLARPPPPLLVLARSAKILS